MSRTTPSTAAYVVDTMVLAMFVDGDRAPLLSALAGESVFVTPSVMDPEELPPFSQQPISEFAKGIFAAQRDLSRPLHATRVQRRSGFYRAVGTAWRPVLLSAVELRLARYLSSSEARLNAKAIDPGLKIRRVGAGEAEAGAVAVARGWTLWSDDAAIINLLGALWPGHPVERISDLLVRAVSEGLIRCQDGADLYNNVFRGTLGLWTSRVLVCQNNRLLTR